MLIAFQVINREAICPKIYTQVFLNSIACLRSKTTLASNEKVDLELLNPNADKFGYEMIFSILLQWFWHLEIWSLGDPEMGKMESESKVGGNSDAVVKRICEGGEKGRTGEGPWVRR